MECVDQKTRPRLRSQHQVPAFQERCRLRAKATAAEQWIAKTCLVGRIIGDLGEVVGVDANPTVLNIARTRAKGARLSNVQFIEASVGVFHSEKEFDAIVGRLFLVHQVVAENILSHVISLLRPGGSCLS